MSDSGSYAQNQVILVFMLENESSCKDMMWEWHKWQNKPREMEEGSTGRRAKQSKREMLLLLTGSTGRASL